MMAAEMRRHINPRLSLSIFLVTRGSSVRLSSIDIFFIENKHHTPPFGSA